MNPSPRISLEKYRRILGKKVEHWTDKDLEAMRERHYGLANGLLDHLAKAKGRSTRKSAISSLDDALPSLPGNVQEAVQERAAIREFEGEMEPDEAERLSLAEALTPE